MSGSLTPWRRLALSELWQESASDRARRRCRALITTPFAAIGGLAWGILGAPVMGAGSTLFWGALGAFAFPFLLYVEQRLMPGWARLARKLGLGDGGLAALATEATVVALLIYMITGVAGAPIVPAVGTALGVGAFYAFAMEYLLCGSGAYDLASLIRGPGMFESRRGDTLSLADTMLTRGDVGGAIAAYRAGVERTPSDGGGYVKLSRALLQDERPEEAVAALRRGIERAKLSQDEDAFLVRQIHDVCVRRLGRPRESIADLTALLSRQTETVHAEWAEREIADIEDGLYDE